MEGGNIILHRKDPHEIRYLKYFNSVYLCEGYVLSHIQGLIKGAKLCLNPYFFWLAGEVSRLAVEVLSPCRK